MGVFERYTEDARRAIYFAHAEAALREAPAISAAHLLLGLSWDEHSMSNTLAELKDRLPELCSQMGTPFRPCSSVRLSPNPQLPLDRDSKITLAYAVKEADFEWCEAIDTDHLLRGLLRFSNVASVALNSVGVNLDAVRSGVRKFRRERPRNQMNLRRIFRFGWSILKPPLQTLAMIAAICLLIVLLLRLIDR
jgi:ATP-dependent Clp protease ATP-binding subunit ClpA